MKFDSTFISALLVFIGFSLSGQEVKNWQVFRAEMEVLDASVTDKVWMGTDNGLYELNENGKISNKYDKLNGLPSNHVRAVMAADGGGSWVGTYAAGIKKVKDSTIMDLPELNNSVKDTFLHAIEKVKGTKKIGILTDLSYHVYDGQEVITQELPSSPMGFRSWNETYFKPESDSTFWISNGHAFKYYNGREYESQMNNNFNPYQDIALAYDDQGRLWASHEDQLAYRENGQWEWMDTSEIGLESSILCMNQNKNGNLYVASENRIVVRKNGSWQKWANLSGNFWENKQDWILSAKSGCLFFPGKSGNALVQFDGTQSKMNTLEAQILENPHSLKTAGNQIWLKTSNPTAFYRLKGSRWENINIPNQYQGKVDGWFQPTKSETFWVKGDSALFRYEGGNWQKFNEQNADLPQMSRQLKSFNGQLWVSSNEGIQKFDNGNFVYPEGISNDFKQLNASRFTVTKEHIYFFDEDAQRLKKWGNGQTTEFNGGWHKGTTGDMTPLFIKNGPKGRVWVSSNSGLAYYNGSDWVFPEALNDIESGLFQGIHDFEKIDSVTFAVATNEGIALSHKNDLQWIQKSNSPLPYKHVTRLAVTEDRKVASIGSYDNDVSVFKLTRPSQGGSTNIAENDLGNNAIKHYPNPVKDQLHIKVSSYSGNAIAYKLLSSQGQVVRQGTLQTEGKQSIEVKTLDQGLYFLNVQAGSVNETRKVLKK